MNTHVKKDIGLALLVFLEGQRNPIYIFLLYYFVFIYYLNTFYFDIIVASILNNVMKIKNKEN